MSGLFDDLIPGADPQQSQPGAFDDLIPRGPAARPPRPLLPTEGAGEAIVNAPGRAARMVVQGVPGVLDMLNNAAGAVLNAPFIAWDAARGNAPGTSEPFRYGQIQRMTTGAADALGLPQYEQSQTGQVLGQIGEAAAGAAPTQIAGRVLAPVLQGTGQTVARAFADAPGIDVTANAAGGGAQGIAQQAGASDLIGMGANFGGAAVTSVVASLIVAAAARRRMAAGAPEPRGVDDLATEELAAAFRDPEMLNTARAAGLTDTEIQQAAEAFRLAAAQRDRIGPSSQAVAPGQPPVVEAMSPRLRQDFMERNPQNPADPSAPRRDFAADLPLPQRTTALVPLEPPIIPNRMTPEEIAHAARVNQIQAERIGQDPLQFGDDPSGRSVAPMDPTPRLRPDQTMRLLPPPEPIRMPDQSGTPPVVGNPPPPPSMPRMTEAGIRAQNPASPDYRAPGAPPQPTAPQPPTPPAPRVREVNVTSVTRPPEPRPETGPAPQAEGAPPPRATTPERAAEFTRLAERSEAAAAKLDAQVAQLQQARERFFDRNTGTNMLAAKGAKAPRDKASRELAALAGKYRTATEIDRAITTRQREAEAARGRAAIQRRGAERAGTPDDVPYRPSYGDPKLDAPAARTPPKAPTSLTAAVKANGGMKGGGDLEGMAPGVRNDKAGLSPDMMVERLQQDGWFPNLTGLDAERALFNALREERSGRPQYRDGDGVEFRAAQEAYDADVTRMNDMAREMGLSPDEVRGMSRGQFEDLMRERLSQEEAANMHRQQAEALEAEVVDLRRALQDEMEARGDAWEPDILRTLDDYLDAYGARSLEDAEAEWRGAVADAEGGAQRGGTPEVAARPEPERGAPGEDRTGAGPGRATEDAPQQPEGSRAETEGGRGPGEQGGEVARGRDPLRKTVEDDGQNVMPGMEASTKQAVQARAEARNNGDVPQRALGDADTPLFDVSARDQMDIMRETGDRGLGGKLYSGGIFDPAVWRLVLGPAARYVTKSFTDAWDQATSALKGSMDNPSREARVPRDPAQPQRSPKIIRRPLRAIGSFMRAALYADDARMRAMADTLPPASREAMRTFLDKWHARAGDARGAGDAYDELVNTNTNRHMQALGKALGDDILRDKAALAQLARMVQNPGSIRAGTKMGDAALALTKLLRELHDYQRQAGVEMGQIKNGYWPRVINDNAVWDNSAGFLRDAEKAYRLAGEPNPKEAAQAWLNNILAGGKHDDVLSPPMSGIQADHVNGRTLPKEADNILRDYLHQDPLHVLTTYITAAARRAEFARAVGQKVQPGGKVVQTNWDALVKALRADGADARIDDVRSYVGSVTGAKYAGTNRSYVRASANIRMWTTLGMLEKATIASLAEAFMPAVRQGNLLKIGESLYRTVDDLVRGHKGKGEAGRLRELAEDIGVIASAYAGSLNAARWTGGDATSSFQSHVLDVYFRRTGLEQWTRGTRVAAVSGAEVFLRRLASDLGKTGTRHERMAGVLLAELGIPKAQQAAFAQWMRGSAGNGMTAAALHLAPKAQAELFRRAVQRFVWQSIMSPNASTRPRWASHPVGAVAFQLSNFAWAFHKNVLARPFNLAKSPDLTRMDAAIMAGSYLTMAAAAMLPAQIVVSYLRSELLDSEDSKRKRREQAARDPIFRSPITDEPVGTDQALLVLSRSGLLGAFDPAFNLVTGVRYGRDLATSLAGPSAGLLLGAAQTGLDSVVGRNSPNTNASERRVARAVWDAGIEPAANWGLTFLPIPLAAILTQAAGHGGVRGAFIDGVAGPEQRQRR